MRDDERARRFWRRTGRGLAFAAAVLGLSCGLAAIVDHQMEAGTRAQAAGASLASLVMLAGGFALGVRGRGGGKIPLLPGLIGAVLLSLAAFIVRMFPSPALGMFVTEGPTAVAVVLRTASFGLPALALGSLGAALGTGSTRASLPVAAVAILGLVGLQFGGAKLLLELFYSPTLVNVWSVSFAAAVCLLVGFLLAFLLRRLAFTEITLVALGYGFLIYLSVALFYESMVRGLDVPKEQVLVALAFAPAAISLCLLAVGASLGFMLMGSGRFDPSFSFEMTVGLRYLSAHTRVPHAEVASSAPRPGVLRRVVLSIFGPEASVSVILAVSVMGVCLGVMALIVVLSVMSGFEDDLKQKILGAHAHIVINKKGDDFREYSDLEERVKSVDGVRSAASFVLGEGMVTSDSNVAGLLVKGIETGNAAATERLRRDIDRGSVDFLLRPEDIPGARPASGRPSSTTADTRGQLGLLAPSDFGEPKNAGVESLPGGRVLPGIIIGRELARALRVRVGDTVGLVSPVSEEIGPTGPQPKIRKFRVGGIFFSGLSEFDTKFGYVELAQAQRFFGMNKKATGVELRVADVDDTPWIVEEVKRRVGGHPYSVRDWREMNKELFSALLLEKLAMFIILVFIVLVASFNIVSTLVMIVLEKGREIAILKSMGATSASIMKVFVVQGLIVGVGGALLGLILGVGTCLLIQRYGVGLDADVFYIDRLPVVMDRAEIGLIGLAAVVITYLATIYPAMAAAQQRPVEGLRDE